MKWRQATMLRRDPATATGKSEKGTANFIFYKFDSDLAALSVVFELVKYTQHHPIWPYGLNESEYPVMTLLLAILVTSEAYKGPAIAMFSP